MTHLWMYTVVDGSYTWDIWTVGPLKACADNDTSGVPLWMEPTSFNCFWCVNLWLCHSCVSHHTYLSIPEKPESATHSSTSTTSAGLLHLSVGALVHFVWKELQANTCGCRTAAPFSWCTSALCLEGAASWCMWLPPPINIHHASQLLASLGGCQLESHSQKREHEPTSVVTRILWLWKGEYCATPSHTSGFTSGLRCWHAAGMAD